MVEAADRQIGGCGMNTEPISASVAPAAAAFVSAAALSDPVGRASETLLLFAPVLAA